MISINRGGHLTYPRSDVASPLGRSTCDVPKSIFWDPKNPLTHHLNYPEMSMSEYIAYQDYAKEKGEQFVPGEKTFETTMRSFRGSSIPSVEPEVRLDHPYLAKRVVPLYMKQYFQSRSKTNAKNKL